MKSAKQLRDDFCSRTSKCPICKTFFKSDSCPHSVVQAKDKLFQNYIKEIAS